MTLMTKREMRILLRNRRANDEVQREQSGMICCHILNSEAYRQAKVIEGYVPLKHEADITPVMKHALQSGKTLVLPRCRKKPQMTLHRITSLEELKSGAYGIPEPPDDAPMLPVDDVDLVLVPLEGIDQKGYRLGKGGGYYDWLLGGRHIPTMGCALRWQMVDELPKDAWDIPLKMCATPDGIRMY